MTERTDWQDKESQDDLEGGQGRADSGTDFTSGTGQGTGGSSGVTGGDMTRDPRTGSTDYGTPMGGSQGDLGEGGLGTGGTGFEQDRMAGGYGAGGTGFEEGTAEGGAGNRSGSGSGGQGESAMYDEEEGDGGIGTTGA